MQLAESTGEQRNEWLLRTAELLGTERELLSEANRQDIAQAPEYGLTDAAVDRLRLTDERIDGMITALNEVVALPDPVRRGVRVQPTAQWPVGDPGASAVGRGVLHFRVAAQRDRRCGGAVREERQRGDPAGGQGSDPQQTRRCTPCWTGRPRIVACLAKWLNWSKPPIGPWWVSFWEWVT